jgi:hypothetical protein
MTDQQQTATQYVVLIYERMSPDWPDDIPPEVAQANEEVDAQIEALGGRILAGAALGPTATATSIRGAAITDGPFIETKEAMAGIYILDARDLDHALACARLTPIMEGGVEVRPLIDFQVTEPS